MRIWVNYGHYESSNKAFWIAGQARNDGLSGSAALAAGWFASLSKIQLRYRDTECLGDAPQCGFIQVCGGFKLRQR